MKSRRRSQVLHNPVTRVDMAVSFNFGLLFVGTLYLKSVDNGIWHRRLITRKQPRAKNTFGKMAGVEALPREGTSILFDVDDDDDIFDKYYSKQT